jgi:hypothetical protein
MKKEIKKIQDYFVSKIEKGDFELKKVVNDRSAKILIDGEYKFWLFWSEQCYMYCHSDENIIMLPEGIDGTILIKRVNVQLKLAKLESIEKLQKEIEKL